MGVEGGVGDSWEKRYIYRVGMFRDRQVMYILNYVKLFSFTKSQMFSRKLCAYRGKKGGMNNSYPEKMS